MSLCRLFLHLFRTWFLVLAFAPLAMAANSNNGSEGHSATVDVSGRHGQDAADGVDRSNQRASGRAATGPRGGDAGPAEPGQTAGAISLELSEAIKGTLKMEGIVRKAGQAAGSLQVYEVLMATPGRVFLDASGGHGGDGGVGGGGGRGGKGTDGSDATRWSNGTDGGRGGTGGAGGLGTSGAYAGDGGPIVLTVNKMDTSLLMMVEHDIDQGRGGRRGEHGQGGRGGPGGDGGSSYSWTETETEHYTDSEGKSQSRTKTTYHSNPGGSDGPRGYSGSTPSTPLHDGNNGQLGSFAMHVKDDDGNVKVYDTRYNLKVEPGFTIRSANRDGIFEPGEALFVENITVTNTGGMPTPIDAKVRLFLHNRAYTQSTGKVLHIPKVLQPGESYTFTGENYLEMDVKTLDFEPEHSRLAWHQDSTPHAMMERVEREFRDAPSPKGIEISFPIEIETIGEGGGISGLRSLAPSEATKVFFKITNRSTKAFGSESELKRAIHYLIQRDHGDLAEEQVQFFSEYAEPLSLEEGIFQAIENLGPGESALVEGIIGMGNDAVPYRSTTLSAGLSLEATNNSEGMTEIQHPTFEVRATQVYRHDPDSKMLLISNSAISENSINAWKEEARRVGEKLTVWDLSYESHMNLFKAVAGGKNLLEHFQGGTIILPTNTFAVSDDANDPLDQLRKHQFLHALTKYGINFLFMGPEKDSGYLTAMLSPSFGSISGNQMDQDIFSRHRSIGEFMDRYEDGHLATQVSEDAEMDFTLFFNRIMLNRYLMWWQRPSEESLTETAMELEADLARADVNDRWMTVTHYRPQLLKKLFWGAINIWNYGGILVTKSLRRDRGSGVFFPMAEEGVDNSRNISNDLTRIALLSTMGFEKNVQLLERYISDSDFYQQSPENLRLVVDTLLLFLAREQGRVRQPGFGLGYSNEGMKTLMTQMNRLANPKVAITPDVHIQVSNAVVELAAKIKYLASVNTTWWEYVIPFRTNNRVRKATHQLADQMIDRFFGLPETLGSTLWQATFGATSPWAEEEIDEQVEALIKGYKAEMAEAYAETESRREGVSKFAIGYKVKPSLPGNILSMVRP